MAVFRWRLSFSPRPFRRSRRIDDVIVQKPPPVDGDDMHFDLRRPRVRGWYAWPFVASAAWMGYRAWQRGATALMWILIVGTACLAAITWMHTRRARVRWTRTLAELERARRGLPALRRELGAAVARGDGVVERLRELGYREFDVRQWILRRLRDSGPVA